MKLAVLALMTVIALWDVGMGLRLLFLPSPQLAHGADTAWSSVGVLAGTPGVASMLQRLGAFSLHAGVTTLVLIAIGARYRPVLTAVLFTYAITGLGFLANDLTYFRGTSYLMIKQLFGALWTLAIVLHLIEGRRTATASSS